jgi:hypothetical protein
MGRLLPSRGAALDQCVDWLNLRSARQLPGRLAVALGELTEMFVQQFGDSRPLWRAKNL